MGWLEPIAALFEKLWPFILVEAWEKAVKFRGGEPVPVPYLTRHGWKLKIEYRKVLTPGVYFAFWWVERIIAESVATDGLPMPVQSLTTADGKAITVSTTIIYRIVNVERKVLVVTDFENSLRDLSKVTTARIVREYRWNDLVSRRVEVEKRLRDSLRPRLRQWGVRLVEVGLVDCVQADQQRRFLSGSVGGGS